MPGLSPMMQQYMQIKEQHKDKVLFFRLGDFYEMFFDDAVEISKALELTLTARDCGLAEKAPMCGVPYHSAESYIARLLEMGYKVAICEQTTTPAQSKGLVEREVVRVITRGTASESSMLADDRNNFLCSIFIEDEKNAGICFSDVSCGIIYLCEITSDRLIRDISGELAKFSPTEIIANPDILKNTEITDFIKQYIACSVELVDDNIYDENVSKEVIEKQFPSEVTGELLAGKKGAIGSVAALVHYLKLTRKTGLSGLRNIEHYNLDSFMRISALTRRHLEITETMRAGERKGSLLHTVDASKTSMGRRLLRLWFEQPLVSSTLINRRLDSVEELFSDTLGREKLRTSLSKISDMERILGRILYKSTSPRELYSFMQTLQLLPDIKMDIAKYTSPDLIAIYRSLDTLKDICELIGETVSDKPPANVRDGELVRSGYNADVDRLRDLSGGAKKRLEELENRYREEYGLKKIKISYNRVFGYYIEVPNSFTSCVPEHFIRRQTLAGCERYVTEELKTLENDIMGAQEKLLALESDIYDKLLCEVASASGRISTTANAVAKIDLLATFAEVAVQYDYRRPSVDDSSVILIKAGRHPVVERQMRRSAFVANDVTADNVHNRVLLITGPNMAGKSTYMRQTALIVLLAQVGCFVPAESAQIGVCDGIYTRVGASDDLAQGQSTFMVEMNEMAQILKNATSKSLLILDEIGRGTSTFDGLAIARAIVEHLAENDVGFYPKTMFATHYHELCILESLYSSVKNYSIIAKKRGGELIFLRKIVQRAADDSYGIEVAKLAGISTRITERAGEILTELEQHSDALSGAAIQLGFGDLGAAPKSSQDDRIMKRLKNIVPDALSPLEAWQILSELKTLSLEVDGDE